MNAANPLYLASLVVFAFGTLTFSILTISYWTERWRHRAAPAGPRKSAVFPVFTLACAAAFLLNLLLQTPLMPYLDVGWLPWLIVARRLAVGLLPALLLHLVLESNGRSSRVLAAAVYTVGAALALAQGLDETGLLPLPPSGLLRHAPAAMLCLTGVLGLAVELLLRCRGAHHYWNRAILLLMAASGAVSLAHPGTALDLLPDYLVLAFFGVTLFYRERLVFFDLLVKRGLFFLAGLVMLTAWFAAAGRFGLKSPWNAGILALLLLPFWLIGPGLYSLAARAVDRLWLRRRYSAHDAGRRFLQDVQSCATEDELHARAAATLSEIFQAEAAVRFAAPMVRAAAVASAATANAGAAPPAPVSRLRAEPGAGAASTAAIGGFTVASAATASGGAAPPAAVSRLGAEPGAGAASTAAIGGSTVASAATASAGAAAPPAAVSRLGAEPGAADAPAAIDGSTVASAATASAGAAAPPAAVSRLGAEPGAADAPAANIGGLTVASAATASAGAAPNAAVSRLRAEPGVADAPAANIGGLTVASAATASAGAAPNAAVSRLRAEPGAADASTAAIGGLTIALPSGGSIALAPRPDGVPYLSDDHRSLASLAASLDVVLENVRFRQERLQQQQREQELRWLASRSELKALRAQINPHFLFNSLNAIAGLIAEDPRLADDTIERLARVFRYTLRKSETEWVPLREELEFVEAYLQVEQARFGDRLRLTFDVSPAAAAIPIPAMSIQPLVENAVKHGVSAVEGPGHVGLRAALESGSLVVEVTDSGAGFPPGFSLDAVPAGHALRNVADRLRGYYGASALLTCDRARVRLTIPTAVPARAGDAA